MTNLASLAALATAIQVDKLPFLALGDYNMFPAKLATTTFAQKLAAAILAPDRGGGTCRAKAGSWSTIDVGVLSRALAWGVLSVIECTECTANPHIPVQIRFYAALASHVALMTGVQPHQSSFWETVAVPRWQRVYFEATVRGPEEPEECKTYDRRR